MSSFEEVTRRAGAGEPEAQELLAAVYEQAGRPAEAAQWLRRAAEAGLPSALARHGLWRLVGFGQTAQPQEGVADISRAASLGDPLGLALAATVTAGGVGRPADPVGALRWLAAAAGAGDGRALCQLGVLLREDPAREAEAGALIAQALAAGFEQAARLRPAPQPAVVDPDRAAEAVDLSWVSAPAPVEEVRAEPRIAVAHRLIPTWACEYVMALAEPVLTRGKVLDETGTESIQAVRSNSVMNFGLIDSDVILELISTRIAMAAAAPPQNAEGLGVLHYAPGEQYAPHVDYIPETPANAQQLAVRGQRVRTVLVYLNEDFEGGATEFIRLGATFKPPAGHALIFDSVRPDGAVDPMTLHRGAPPTRGQKWVISKWFRTKPLRPGPGS